MIRRGFLDGLYVGRNVHVRLSLPKVAWPRWQWGLVRNPQPCVRVQIHLGPIVITLYQPRCRH